MRRRLKAPGPVAGFTLVELVVFIVVAGLMAVGIMAAFSGSLSGAPNTGTMTQAMHLAQQRMALILASKRLAPDYATFIANYDPCAGGAPPAVCTPLPGYTVSVTPPAASALACAPNCDQITVNVSGPSNASLTVLVADF